MDNKNTPTKKIFYKRWWFLILIGVVLFSALSSNGNQQQSTTYQNQPIVHKNILPVVKNEEISTTTTKAKVITPIESALVVKEKTAQTSITSPATANTQYTYYSVSSVVDGDTIKISMNGKVETLRLIGIDTPETVDPRKPVQCFGKEASNKGKELLNGKKVRIEMDSTQGERDKYSRLLAYVYRDDGLFFNKYMIEQGYAHEYTYNTPYKYQTEFKTAEKNARISQLGLWNPSTCNGITTTAIIATPTVQTSSTQLIGHTFYLSSYHTSTYYYCDTDNGWKELSSKYLKSYTSEQALLVDYPTKKLHQACQ
jgi:endonuclease YncB( thermonuclease family)